MSKEFNKAENSDFEWNYYSIFNNSKKNQDFSCNESSGDKSNDDSSLKHLYSYETTQATEKDILSTDINNNQNYIKNFKVNSLESRSDEMNKRGIQILHHDPSHRPYYETSINNANTHNSNCSNYNNTNNMPENSNLKPKKATITKKGKPVNINIKETEINLNKRSSSNHNLVVNNPNPIFKVWKTHKHCDFDSFLIKLFNFVNKKRIKPYLDRIYDNNKNRKNKKTIFKYPNYNTFSRQLFQNNISEDKIQSNLSLTLEQILTTESYFFTKNKKYCDQNKKIINQLKSTNSPVYAYLTKRKIAYFYRHLDSPKKIYVRRKLIMKKKHRYINSYFFKLFLKRSHLRKLLKTNRN